MPHPRHHEERLGVTLTPSTDGRERENEITGRRGRRPLPFCLTLALHRSAFIKRTRLCWMHPIDTLRSGGLGDRPEPTRGSKGEPYGAGSPLILPERISPLIILSERPPLCLS